MAQDSSGVPARQPRLGVAEVRSLKGSSWTMDWQELRYQLLDRTHGDNVDGVGYEH
jgi:hypothetical protein